MTINLAANWVQATRVYTNRDNSFYPICLWVNSWWDQSEYQTIPPGLVWGQWNTVDLKPYGVTADALWAMIGGIMIITGPADLCLAFRTPGSTQITEWDWYQQQSLSARPDIGDRSGMFDLVPLVNGCFEVLPTGKRYPDDGLPIVPHDLPAVGFNIKIKAWGRA